MAQELNNKTVSNIQIWDQLWESGLEGLGARAVNLSTSLVLNACWNVGHVGHEG